jgi:VanZ family protein
MPQFLIPLIGLALVFLISEICGRVFNIKKDAYYAHFHFVGGLLTCLLFFALTKDKIMAVVLTLVTGVLWEIYEYFRYTYLPKRITIKLTRKDTRNDLLLDLLGALLGMAVLYLLRL